jgi:hypothetical protein
MTKIRSRDGDILFDTYKVRSSLYHINMFDTDDIQYWKAVMEQPIDLIARVQLMHQVRIQRYLTKWRRYLITHVFKELIAEAMHPRRMMARLGQSDDFDSFFECC